MSKKLLSVGVVLALVATVLVGVGATTASAQTMSLCQTVDALVLAGVIAPDKVAAAKAAAGCTAAAPAGSYTFTRNLTIGSTGADVTALQTKLGVTPATGYFGNITKAAVIAYQTANGIAPAAGYVGPITLAKLNGGVATLPAGECPAGMTCTPVATACPAGYTCTVTGAGSNGLTGGAGSLSGYVLDSALSNEEVGEGASDVKVYGLEMDADDNSDIELMAIKLVFNEGTAGSDFDKYAEDVSIWLGSKELARIDADEFTDESGTANDWTKTVSLASGGVIAAGETGTLYIAVSGISNLDSTDATDTWTIDPSSLRYRDSQGTVISEDPGTGARTFSFDTFATASSLEMKTNLASSNPKEGAVIVNDEGDDVTLLKFKIKAEGSDILIKEVPVVITSGVSNIADLVDSATLSWAGGSMDVDLDDADTAETPNFDELGDLTIAEGTTVEFTVTVNSATSSVTDAIAETLQATVTPDNIVAKDDSGETIVDADSSGSAIGETQHVFTKAPEVVVKSVSIVKDQANQYDTGATGHIVIQVTARGGTIYLNGDDSTTAAKRFAVTARDGGSAASSTVTGSYTLSGDITTTAGGTGGEYYTILEDETATIDVKLVIAQGNGTASLSTGALISSLNYGTATDSETTRSAVAMSWTDLTDLLKTGQVTLTTTP